MKVIDTEKAERGKVKDNTKRPYERAKIEEHAPLEEATAYVYYYYTYAW